jgi:hypothetical protein
VFPISLPVFAGRDRMSHETEVGMGWRACQCGNCREDIRVPRAVNLDRWRASSRV